MISMSGRTKFRVPIYNNYRVTRVAVGMGIPIWIPIPMGLGWVWEYDFLLWGYPYWDPHRGKSYIHTDIHMGIPTEILWEWDGNGNGNSLPTATLVTTNVRQSRHNLCDRSSYR